MEIHSKQVQSLLQENQQLKSTIDQQRKELSIRDSVIQQLEGKIEMMIEKLSVHSIQLTKARNLEHKMMKMAELLAKLETKNKQRMQELGEESKKKSEIIDEKFQKLKEKIDAQKQKIAKYPLKSIDLNCSSSSFKRKQPNFEDLKRERIISTPNMDSLLKVRKCYSRDEYC